MTSIRPNNPYAALGAQKMQQQARNAAQNSIKIQSPESRQPNVKEIKNPSSFQNVMEDGLNSIKDIGGNADKSAATFSLGGGNYAGTALDTKVWKTTVELMSGVRNEIVSTVKKIQDTPL
jgi:flagellar hook-basal body complex protein FliE